MSRRIGSGPQADVGGALGVATKDFFQTAGLSVREQEILELAAHGLVDKEISDQLGLAYTTIKSYWFRICFKLNAKNRQLAIGRLIADLAEKARQFMNAHAECPVPVSTQRGRLSPGVDRNPKTSPGLPRCRSRKPALLR